MATSVSGKEAAINELLSCGICLHQYTDPRRLPCHHSFCKGCIDGLLATDYTCCPTCRNPFQLSDYTAASLPVAFDINHLLEIMSKNDETVSVLNGQQTEPAEPQFQVCQAHGRPKDMYCDTCEDYICLKCSLKSHHSHHCDRAELLFTKHRQQIEASLEPMKNKIEDLEHTLTRFDTREKEMKDQETATQTEIDRLRQDLVDRLEESQRKLSYKLSNVVQSKLQRHAIERAKVETILAEMKSCCDYVSEELKTRSDYQLQAAKVEYIRRISDTHSGTWVSMLQPTQLDTVFIADRNASGCIGKIINKPISKKK